VDEDGNHFYRARFRLGRFTSRYLDVELPSAPSALGLKTLFDGKPIAWRPVSESNQTRDSDKLARVPVPALFEQKSSVFELIYQTAPRHGGIWSTTSQLQPPLLQGTVGRAPVRWQVTLPSSWLALDTDSGFRSEQSWSLRRGLLTPQPIESSADLQRWLLGPDLAAGETEKESKPTSSLTGWRTEFEPFRLVWLPRQIWLLFCSLSFLILGLGVYFLVMRRSLFWLLVLPLGLATAFVALTWPGLLADVIYGCEPGFAVLVLILGVQWLLHRRYRRKLMFMPGFSRIKTGSAVVRGSVASGARSDRPNGEPSTVDIPKPTVGSSLLRLAEVEKTEGAKS
jgi:hypothetical protein